MGYPADLFIGEPVVDQFKCMICRQVLEDAVMVLPCEDVFCRDCVDATDCCPIDGQLISSLRGPQRHYLSLLNGLQLKCPLFENGCRAIVKLGDLTSHKTVCLYNPDRSQPCVDGCGAVLSRAEVLEHDCVNYLRAQLDQKDDELELTKQQLQLEKLRHERCKIRLAQLLAAIPGPSSSSGGGGAAAAAAIPSGSGSAGSGSSSSSSSSLSLAPTLQQQQQPPESPAEKRARVLDLSRGHNLREDGSSISLGGEAILTRVNPGCFALSRLPRSEASVSLGRMLGNFGAAQGSSSGTSAGAGVAAAGANPLLAPSADGPSASSSGAAAGLNNNNNNNNAANRTHKRSLFAMLNSAMGIGEGSGGGGGGGGGGESSAAAAAGGAAQPQQRPRHNAPIAICTNRKNIREEMKEKITQIVTEMYDRYSSWQISPSSTRAAREVMRYKTEWKLNEEEDFSEWEVIIYDDPGAGAGEEIPESANSSIDVTLGDVTFGIWRN